MQMYCSGKVKKVYHYSPMEGHFPHWPDTSFSTQPLSIGPRKYVIGPNGEIPDLRLPEDSAWKVGKIVASVVMAVTLLLVTREAMHVYRNRTENQRPHRGNIDPQVRAR